ncbi:16525_t:CDS:2, partial [Acaulospora colombiana]
DHETQVWVRLWDNVIPEEDWETVEDKYLYMYMDKDLPIRFRVIDEKFTDVGSKGPPPKRTGAVAGQKAPIPAPSSLPSDVMINPIAIDATNESGAGGAGSGSKQGLSQSSTMLGSKPTTPFISTKQAPYELIGSIAERGLAILDFVPPRGFNFEISKIQTSVFKSSYTMNTLPLLNGSIDGELFGIKGLYHLVRHNPEEDNLDTENSSKEITQEVKMHESNTVKLAAVNEKNFSEELTETGENEEVEALKGEWSVGAEVFYGVQERSGG